MKRIPRLSAAVLLLGAACGEDAQPPGGSTEGVVVSAERLRSVVHASCKSRQRCDPNFAARFTDLDTCAAQSLGYFDDLIAEDDTCADALLDLASCTSRLSCSALDEVDAEGGAKHCAEYLAQVDEACRMASYTPSDAPVSAALRMLRIPAPR